MIKDKNARVLRTPPGYQRAHATPVIDIDVDVDDNTKILPSDAR